MRVLITGATGSLGRAILASPSAGALQFRCLSRRSPSVGASPHVEWVTADLASGEGLERAVRDVDTIVHAASDPARADEVDVRGTRRLIDFARAARVRHVIYVSIVGVDRIPYAYYARKLAVEAMLMESGLPISILRATQFHSLIDGLLARLARIPLVMPLPARFKVQSVDECEVAERLLHAIDDGPLGRLRDFGGPEVMTLATAATTWKRAMRIAKPILPFPLPGRTAAAFRAGENTAPGGDHGRISWREWLGSRPA